jgi:hypothetical protein
MILTNKEKFMTNLPETYAIHYQNPEMESYARMPASLYHLTYIVEIELSDGTKHFIRKRISPRARDLYCYMKIIGKKSCWLHQKDLAEAIGCSEGTISKCRKELTQNFEQLNNKSLITINEKKKRYKDAQGKQQSTIYYESIIVDIIRESNGFIATYLEAKKNGIEYKGYAHDLNVHNLPAESNNDRANAPESNNDRGSLGAESNNDRNNRITETNVTCKITDNPAIAECCQFKDNLSVTEMVEQAETLQDMAILEMRLFNIDSNMMKEMIKRFPPQQIIDGINYALEQKRRCKIRNNPQGYARKCIENKRKWQKR